MRGPGGNSGSTTSGALCLLFLCSLALACRDAEPVTPLPTRRWQEARLTRGLLRVLELGPATENATAPPEIHATYRRGADYDGHEDNDLRGNLDGTFKWGWNQPGQIHVRVGRRDRAPAYGELELFRVLHRFAGLGLPRDAQIAGASLELHVEEGPDTPLRLLLYPVHSDFSPGAGGTERDNVSPPAPGEVWWNDRVYPDEPWGMPGLGAAGSVEAGADTGRMPLAEALYTPGDATLRFTSPELARYVASQVAREDSLRFLLKLTDRHEDLPVGAITIFAASDGDTRAPLRRPRLDLRWTSARARVRHSQPVRLERGRILEERVDLTGEGPLVIDFAPDPESGPATVELHEGDTDAWRRVPLGRPVAVTGGSVRVRLSALREPVVLGEPFRTGFRDTWIRTAAPEDQQVEFTFTSPSGIAHTALARYDGDYGFSLEFVPDELGAWQYRFTKRFTDHPLESAPAEFDVVGGDTTNVIAQLQALRARIEGTPEPQRGASDPWLSLQLSKLERAGLQSLDPATFRGPGGRALLSELARVREAISGEPMPAELPLEPSPPARWQRTEP